MSESNTWINAIIGAVVTVLLSFTAVSPVIGGAVTAYLEKGTTSEGLRSGALSGTIVLVPMVLLGFVAIVGFGLFAFDPGGVIAIGLFVLVGLAVAAAWTVGLSALGGYLGAYLYAEYGGGSGGTPEYEETEQEVRV
ncbi:DUF5518 domain-containing protein [Natronorarus salvus]|uniref:DUF5518 domain-containing protein n=1 Tax=Natronorarus salvus TaxID=3117733 RepID=UPI002F266AD3